jgi:hypothetical protein
MWGINNEFVSLRIEVGSSLKSCNVTSVTINSVSTILSRFIFVGSTCSMDQTLGPFRGLFVVSGTLKTINTSACFLKKTIRLHSLVQSAKCRSDCVCRSMHDNGVMHAQKLHSSVIQNLPKLGHCEAAIKLVKGSCTLFRNPVIELVCRTGTSDGIESQTIGDTKE